MRKIPEKHWPYFIYLALTAVTLVVFWQVRAFDFVNYDDDKYVSKNEHISTGLTWENIIWVFTTAHVGNWHPLTGLSHILDCQFFDLRPGLHHLINLLFHIANTLLLFTILRKMTGTIWPSTFVAVLFAIHPLHIESVAWISERKDVLSTFFWFLTMAAYFNYTRKPNAVRYILALVLFAMGLMAKPMLVTLPFVLLLLDYWPLNRMELKNIGQIFHSVREKIPFFILSVVSSIVTFDVQKSSGAVRQIELLPMMVRINNAVVSYGKYLLKVIWPARLAIFYPHPASMLPRWQILTAAVLLLFITVFVIRFAKKYKYVFVGWFWYLGTLVPVIGLIQVGSQAMADRYTYIPLTGLFIIIAWGTNDLLISWKYRKVALIPSSIVVVLVLSVCTWRQTNYWRNSRTLFEHAVKVTDKNYVAYDYLGFTFIEQNKFAESVNLFQRAIQANPGYASAYNNLGFTYSNLGRYAEAVEAYKQALKINPDLTDACVNLGITCSELGRYENAIEAYHRAIKINPRYSKTYNSLGIAYDNLGRNQDAIEAYKKAISIEPNFAEAYNNLGRIYGKLGRVQEEIEAYKQAIKINPGFSKMHYNLGIAYDKLGRDQDAIAACKKAISIEPDFVEAYNNLGRIYSKLGRDEQAVEAYRQAEKIDPNVPQLHCNLGDALTRQDQFAEAAAEFRKAITKDTSDSDIYNKLGVVLGRQGKFDEAVAQFSEALRLKPDFADTHYNLGYVFLCQNKFDQAVTQLERASRLDPNSDKAQYYLAVALSSKGSVDEAVTHYEAALKLRPDWIEPMNSLAWLCSVCNDTVFYNPQKAVQLAQHACELTGNRNAAILDTLAVAYAAAGNFQEAVAAAEKAFDIARTEKNNKLAEQIQKRLDLYIKKQPYMELCPK
jgi:tetratricopeptide (TPR) repeat protein